HTRCLSDWSSDVCSSDLLTVQNATAEAVETALEEQGGRLTLWSDEAEFWEIAAGRYGKSPNLDIFLKGYDGSPVIVRRMSRQVRSEERRVGKECGARVWR